MDRVAYTIGVTDVLRINVWKNPELTVDAVPVRADGMISVPLINDVQAEGLTPEELKDVMHARLTSTWGRPQVTVVVIQMNSRFVSVIGEVGQDTRVPLTRDLRVLEAIASAAASVRSPTNRTSESCVATRMEPRRNTVRLHRLHPGSSTGDQHRAPARRHDRRSRLRTHDETRDLHTLLVVCAAMPASPPSSSSRPAARSSTTTTCSARRPQERRRSVPAAAGLPDPRGSRARVQLLGGYEAPIEFSADYTRS
jgi:protein involved in polysaccharide export with SLBB domain